MHRIDYFSIKPGFITQLRAVTRQQEAFTLPRSLRALLEIRVSQINGCAYCTDLHSREARGLDEPQQRMDSLPVWRDSPFFTEAEKAAFSWAESLAHLGGGHVEEADYERLRRHFSDVEIVEMSLSISLTCFWNRMAVGFRKMPAACPENDLCNP